MIEDGTLHVMHRGTLVPFPGDDLSRGDYLDILSDLEPAGSRLRSYVNSLDRQAAPAN